MMLKSKPTVIFFSLAILAGILSDVYPLNYYDLWIDEFYIGFDFWELGKLLAVTFVLTGVIVYHRYKA